MKKALFFWLSLLLAGNELLAQIPLITYGSSWKYLDNGTDQGTAWRSLSFNDSSWKTGNGKFGYGVSGLATVVSYGPDPKQKYITTYFRKTIFLTDPSSFTSFSTGVLRDDGIVVYVNGVEVYRNNMPTGSINYLTFGKDASDNGTVTQSFNINKSAFVNGDNIIAVEIHQKTVTNADLAFDLKLSGVKDQTPPTAVSIQRQSPATQVTNASTLIFRANFSKKVRGVDNSDFTLTTVSGTAAGVLANGAVTAVGTDSISYDVTVSSVLGDGTLRLDLNGSGTGITDTAGIAISTGYTNGETYILDHTPPFVASILRQSPATQLTNDSMVIFRITFSEKVTGVDENDFTLTTVSGTAGGVLANGAVAAVGADSIAYDVTVRSVQGEGTLRLDLNGSGTGIADIVGNAIHTGFTNGATYILDHTAPFAVSILRQLPGSQLTNASTLIFRITFSEKVTGVDKNDFTLTTVAGATYGVLANGAVAPVDTDSIVYDVTVSSIVGDGTLRLDLNGSGTGITDAAGNAISAGFTNGETYTVQPPPVVTGIQRQSPATQLTNASTVIFRTNFSKKVRGVDSSDFTVTTVSGTAAGVLANGAVTAVATDSISYDVTVSNVQGDGTLRLDLNGSGTGITDTAGIAISTGFTSGETYKLDRTPPFVASILRQSPAIQLTNDVTVIFRIAFSEKVTGVDENDFTLTTVSGTAGGVLANGAVAAVDNDSIIYDVTVSSIQGEGTLRLDLNGSGTGITDSAGNAIDSGFTNGATYIIQQLLPPEVTAIQRQSPTTQLTNASTVIFRTTFSKKVRGVDHSDFTLTTVSGTAGGVLTNGAVTAVGTDSISYDVTVSSVQGDGTLRLDLNGSGTGITDTAGFAISSGFTNGETYIFDHTQPFAVSIQRQSPATQVTSDSTVKWRITFSEKVTGVDKNDFTLITVAGAANGVLRDTAVLPVGTNGVTYDVTVHAVQGNGTLRLDLNGSGTGITDTAGNAISTGFANGETYIIEQQVPEGPPIVTSISRQLPANEQTDTTAVTFRVIFSEKVRGVDAADFIIFTQSGNVRGTLTKVAQQAVSASLVDAVKVVGTDSTTYDVTIRAIAGSGVLRLDVKGSNTGIKDTVGNVLNSGYTNGQKYTINASLSQGFQSFVDLDPLSISSATREIPQTKLWHYSGKWWAVAATSAGTKIFRLDSTSWTDVLTIATATNSRSDCKVAGNLVHLLLFRGASATSYFVSLEYDPALNSYKRWTQRTSNVNIVFESGTVTATLDMDGTGRIWIASNTNGNMLVRWSDAPYATWSAPITIASGGVGEDICAITALPGKIGVFWSNQNAKRFGFKTHIDGADPTVWSADEVPAGQSALNAGAGMADDKLNIMPASDGTLYCAVKTGYDKVGFPTIALLVRRPNNTWDNLYPVTSSKEGNRPIVVLNEAAGKVKVMYSTHNINFDGTRSGDILYRESSTAAISFGPPVTLISGAGNYNLEYTTSAHQTYNPTIVVWATNQSVSPLKAVGVLATDGASPGILARSSTSPVLIEDAGNKGSWLVYPNPFATSTTVVFTLPGSGKYSVMLYDSKGRRIRVLRYGWAEAGAPNSVSIDGSNLAGGLYYIKVQAGMKIKTLKLHKR